MQPLDRRLPESATRLCSVRRNRGIDTIKQCAAVKSGPTRTRTWNQGIMSPLL